MYELALMPMTNLPSFKVSERDGAAADIMAGFADAVFLELFGLVCVKRGENVFAAGGHQVDANAQPGDIRGEGIFHFDGDRVNRKRLSVIRSAAFFTRTAMGLNGRSVAGISAAE